VNPRYTSQTYHECGYIGSCGPQAEFKCTNDDCHVTEFQADINAAANIAGRVDPWAESVPWKPERDDFLEDGVF
jgi:putative transposase